MIVYHVVRTWNQLCKTQHISQFLELALRVSGRCLQAYPVTAGTFRAPETVYWRGCVTASIVWLTLTATNMCLPKTFQGMKVPVTTAFGPPQNSDTVFFCSWSRLNSFSHKFIAEDNFFANFVTDNSLHNIILDQFLWNLWYEKPNFVQMSYQKLFLHIVVSYHLLQGPKTSYYSWRAKIELLDVR